MLAFERSVSAVSSAACASAIVALATSTAALAVATAASWASRSVRDGILPPESLLSSLRRLSFTWASLSVALLSASLASALANEARALATLESRLRVSSSMSNWSVLISSLTSTLTLRTMPDSSEPSVTVRIGLSVPSAETVTSRLPVLAVCVT